MRRTIALLVLSSLAAGAEPSGPGAQLNADGKSAEWRQATARCRKLLAKLRADETLVRKHRPAVRRALALLQRTDAFDWKSRTAVAFAENLLADLAAGAEPHKRYAGRGLGFPYWSETMRRVEAIWVHVPPAYDPAGEHQLFLYYKCGGGIHLKDGKVCGGYRPTVEVANQTDTFHAWSSLSIQVKGRQGAVRELMEAPAALAEAFSISRDRVFLSGWSDGGFTALWLASRHPHLVAGIAPTCANWQYSNVNDVGLLNVPVLCVDGWGDGGYNSGQFRRWHVLQTLGGDVAGLWGHHGHAYKPYEDIEELRRILDWAKARRRDLWPKRVRYATWNLSWHRAYWLSIERMARPWLAARIDAQVRGRGRIDVSAWNVAAYRLTLSDKLVDPAAAVTVATNGKESYRGPFRKELLIELTKRPPGKFVKSAAMPGGILAQIERSTYQAKPSGGLRVPGRRWLWVRPTGGDAATRKRLAKWAPDWAKDDTAVTDADLAGANLFVYGGPAVNRLTARIAADLPVRFGQGRFTVGERRYDGPTNCVKLIHPNPLNPGRYVIVYAFNDAAAFAAGGFFGTRGEGAWGFRTGDCVVMGVPGEPRRWGVTRTERPFAEHHYVFGANYRPVREAPVGRLDGPFSYAQLLRLRADAAREAAGADVGIVAACTPSWNLWHGCLPAGPVTTHDLATVEKLPEYISLCEVRGSELRRIVERAAASTPLADIEPTKTYRAAMGYRDLPAYGAEPKKMPKLHFFRTPEEFLAGGQTRLPVRKLRISPIEMTSAVAEYIRKRKAVSPRATRFDLTQYVMDPQANHFCGYDWLHLGADVRSKHPQTHEALADRYTLGLALQPAGAARLAPPRDNAKRFLDADLAGAEAIRFDFASLGLKLPVSAATVATPVTVAADRTGAAFRLAGADARDGVVARGTLVEVVLTNRGRRAAAGLAVLAPSAMLRVEGSTWPDKSLRRPTTSCYAGYRRAIGPRRKPPVHQSAALLLLDAPGKKFDVLVAKGAGYNFGLVGIARPVAVPAGGKASVALLLVAAERPGLDLAAALEGVKDALAAKLSAAAGKAP